MKNKKHVIVLLALLIVQGTLSRLTVEAAEDKPIIVCTTEVLGSLVRGYLGDEADVVVLVNPSLCPADFDMKPSDVYAVRHAEILFKQDIPGEFWLQGLIEASGNVDLIQEAVLGVYNTPEGAKRYIEGVGDSLTDIYGLDLTTRKEMMLMEIDDVQNWVTSLARDYDAFSIKVICMSWQKTFVESAGFQVVATYDPPETLSASDINSLIDTAENMGVALIVDNLQIDVEFGKGVAAQVGAEHVVLTNFPGAIPGTESLAEMLRYNTDQLYRSIDIWRNTSSIKAEKEALESQVFVYQVAAVLAAVIAGVEAVLLYRWRKEK